MLTRRDMLGAGFGLAAGGAFAAELRERPQAGLWLRIRDVAELSDGLALVGRRNALFTRKSRRAPWIGLVFAQTWGEIELSRDTLRTEPLLRVLDAARAAGLYVVVQVSDKEWQYKPTNADYSPPVPLDLDRGPVDRSAFAACARGVCQDPVRYMSMHDDTVKGRPGDSVRKYVAKRWALRERWFAMWARLGQSIGDHEALYAVLTPESALALPSFELLAEVGYPGSDWFVDYLVAQARAMRAAFPPHVQVVSNVNVVPPDNAVQLPRVMRQVAADGLSVWAQDLNPSGGAYRVLYPLLPQFPPARRWAMVTNTSSLPPEGMIALAQELGVGHLAFLNHRFARQVEAVEQLGRGQASFLPD